MSKNSQMNTRTMSARRVAAAEDFSIAEAMNEVDEADHAARQSKHGMFARWISGRGLYELEQAGVAAFEEVTNVRCLPYNLLFSESQNLTVAGYRHNYATTKPYSMEQGDLLIEKAARFGGWLKAAAKLPAVRKLLQKSQSRNGVNSPWTKIDLRDLVAHFPSPGALERRLWAVKKRAEAILLAYEGGIKPSWVNIVRGLMADKSVGKAAIIAVANQLSGRDRWVGGFGKYVWARNWLVEHRSAAYTIVDNSDGVAVRLATVPAYNRHGVQVFRALQMGQYGERSLIWLVRKGERTYHSDWVKPVDAALQAFRAWKEQDRLEADASNRYPEVVAFLKGEGGTCPLITREDSYRAGNCQPGTEAWVREMGWVGKTFIPGPALIPHLQDTRVLRVVQAALEVRAA